MNSSHVPSYLSTTTTLPSMRLPHRGYRHKPRHIPRRTNGVTNNLQSTNKCFRCPGSAKDGDGGDNIAVLIDADNVSYRFLPSVMAEVTKTGTASVRRIYGDWSNPILSSWRGTIQDHAIVPIQQFAHGKGKNSSDGALMVDAMDLLHTDRFTRFCLITSDSDFTRLVTRIREQGVAVHGFGNSSTHPAFTSACNKFFVLNHLPGAPITVAPTSPSPSSAPLIVRDPVTVALAPHTPAALEGIRAAVLENSHGDSSSFVNLSGVCTSLTELLPALPSSSYDYHRLRDLVLRSGIVEMKMEGETAFVRLKGGWRDTTINATEPLTTSKPPLPPTEEENPAFSSVKPLKDPTALEAIRRTIMYLNRGKDVSSFIDLRRLERHLTKASFETRAALDFKYHGYSTLREFLQASRLVKLTGTNSSGMLRLKDKHINLMPLTPEPPSPSREHAPSPRPGDKPIDEAALEGIRKTITAILPDGQDPFANIPLSEFADYYVHKLSPALNHRNYGFPQLRDFLLASGIVELECEQAFAWIRLKRDNPIFDRTMLALLRAAIATSPPYKGGSFVTLSDVRNRLIKASPGFAPSKYGFTRLRDLVIASGIVEAHKVPSAVLVRLWDESELGEASRQEREFNMREMMTEKGEEEMESRTRLEVTDGAEEDGLLGPLAKDEHEHEQSHAHQTSLALVGLEDEEDGGERRTPSQSDDCHGYDCRRSMALVRPDDSHGPDLEHRTPLAIKAEPAVENGTLESAHEYDLEHCTSSATRHEASSAIAAPEDPQHGHGDDQQGIGMPLTLDYGPEHEPDDISSPSKGKPDQKTSTSLAPKDEPELENSVSSTPKSEPEPKPEPEPEPEPEPKPKPKTTPLASLARSFFFSEGR
jgi:hypothetical protein